MNQTAVRIRRTRHPLGTVALALFVAFGANAQAQAQAAKKVLGIGDYSRWRSINASRISGDGNWVTYGLRQANALDPLPVLHFLRLDSNKDQEIANGAAAVFSDDSRWAAYYVDLPYADAKKLRDGSKPVPRKAQLMELQTGTVATWEDIASFSFAPGSGHLLLRRRQADARSKHKGVDVILRNLRTGSDQLLGSVNEAAFNRKGELLAYTVDAAERDANGLFVLDLRGGRVLPFDNDARNYSRIAWNEQGTSLAALKGKEIEKKREKENILLAFPDVYGVLTPSAKAAPLKLDPATTTGFPINTVVSEKRELVWSANGKLVFLGVKEQSEAPDTTDKKKGTDELPDVDVWNTRDERIQSLQMGRAENDRNFTYRAVFDVSVGKFVTLADQTMRELDLSLDGRWGVGRDDRGYISDYKRPSADLYRVNLATGERTPMMKGQITNTLTGSHVYGISPDGGKYLYWKDNQFHVFNFETGASTQITRNGVSFVDLDFDHPGPKPPYGLASWTPDGKAVVLTHRYDLYLVPLDGGAPVNLTKGFGTKNEIRFRYVNTQSTEHMGPLERTLAVAIDPGKPMLLSAYGQWTKKSGYYELRNGELKELVFEDAAYGAPQKAAKADKFLFTRETFREFPDLRVAGPSFADPKKITDANPQQAEYAWGRRILFDYTNKKGVKLQGILALPDDYKPGEKRPMIVTFYEKNSQNLHRYSSPSFLTGMGSSPIEAVSKGYITMLPDVHFNTGASHSDMLECVEAATRKVIELGYADPKRIGVHGHSYGGQGTAFVGTRSKLFAAVGMGAGVTDLTSDFNQNWGWSYEIKGRDGSNGFDYYLYSQGRHGTDPWRDPELYRFESGLTHVPEATAPFLIMHGTADPTVAFNEGLGFYNALRYNNKNAVLLAYPGEGHGLRGLANRRDLTIRYFQFFDHYLRGEPAPKWLTEGVPFLEKDLRRDASKGE